LELFMRYQLVGEKYGEFLNIETIKRRYFFAKVASKLFRVC